MRLIRSRQADDEDAVALVRARMARLTGTAPRNRPVPGAEAVLTDDAAEAQDGHDGGSSPAPEWPEWRAALADRVPLPLRRGRAGLERGHVAVVVLVVVLGAVGAVLLLGTGRPEVVPIEATVDASATPSPSPSDDDAAVADPSSGPAPVSASPPAQEQTAGPIVVHVAGLVVSPGVVELPQGSRVIDAVEAAGGPSDEADLTPINLARVLSDGEQVVVASEPPPGTPLGAPPEAPADDGVGAGPGDVASEPVNLNTATQAELETLPGIGPALAQRILDWRMQHGQFSVIDELLEVSGIGEVRFADIEGLVTV